MCPEGSHTSSPLPNDADDEGQGGPPDWEKVDLPPSHILAHLTDAHCHPTDLDLDSSDFDGVHLGGMCAMATDPWNQGKVMRLGEARPWGSSSGSPASSSSSRGTTLPMSDAGEGQGDRKGKGKVKVISSFGYHPWFTHLYTLAPTAPKKEEHYASIFFKPGSSPGSKNRQLLTTLLPYLPDPLPFPDLLEGLRRDIKAAQKRGTHVLLGEVGLDGGARVRWPVAARHLYTEKYGNDKGEEEVLDEHGEWKRLTPFKVSMKHQQEVFRLQMEVAVEMGVGASVHSVAAAGPTMDVLVALRDKHRTRFTNRINVDIHSAGGWSPEFWRQAEVCISFSPSAPVGLPVLARKQLSNLYASPSIFITGRSAHADELIAAISPERMLVESDSHDARLSTRLVWAAVLWIGRVKGWRVEGVNGPLTGSALSMERVEPGTHGALGKEGEGAQWDFRDENDEETFDERGTPISEEPRWTVRTLERNMARFLRCGEYFYA